MRTTQLFGTIAENRRQKGTKPQSESPASSNRSHEIRRKPLPPRPDHGGLADISDLHTVLPEVRPVSPLQMGQRATTSSDASDHVRLPPGLQIRDSEDTTVEEVWHPAVTQQTVEHRKIEILHPQIERDIHVHHYYEYEQPLQVTEVLPARHYRLDQQTGQKVEIEASGHWKMPTSLTPKAVDLSDLKGTHRHYLVDEAHPRGVIERWPPEAETTKT